MSAKCCPTCKRPFSPEVQLSGKRRQLLYDYVAKHPEGVTSQQITDYVWNDDVNGGPNARYIVSTMAWQINRELEKRGVNARLRGSGGPGSVYRIYSDGFKETPIRPIKKGVKNGGARSVRWAHMGNPTKT